MYTLPYDLTLFGFTLIITTLMLLAVVFSIDYNYTVKETPLVVLSKKGHPMTPKQVENRSKQIGFDICFYNRIIAVYNMKYLANLCKKILDSPSEKLNLSLEQIQKVRTDFKYANTKIAKYINKSRNHPHLDILQALAA